MGVFYLDSTPTMPGKFIVRVHHDQFHCKGTLGSYNILEARLFNISPANYYRLCRDEYGGEIYGKNCNYPVVYFNDDEKAHLLIKTLNKLADLVESEREHADALKWAENNKAND